MGNDNITQTKNLHVIMLRTSTKTQKSIFFSKIVDLSWSTNNPLPLFGIGMNGHIDCKGIMMHVIRFAK